MHAMHMHTYIDISCVVSLDFLLLFTHSSCYNATCHACYSDTGTGWVTYSDFLLKLFTAKKFSADEELGAERGQLLQIQQLYEHMQFWLQFYHKF